MSYFLPTLLHNCPHDALANLFPSIEPHGIYRISLSRIDSLIVCTVTDTTISNIKTNTINISIITETIIDTIINTSPTPSSTPSPPPSPHVGAARPLCLGWGQQRRAAGPLLRPLPGLIMPPAPCPLTPPPPPPHPSTPHIVLYHTSTTL
jgi:hypothetical protein